MNVVHIGYPKTGTTFLQWNVFPKLKNWNFIDYHQSHQIFMDLIYLDDLDYDKKLVEKRLSLFSKEGNNLASYETLSGAPFKFKGLGRSAIPERLKQLGFDKVIITIRDQVSLVDSMYRQYVVQGGVMGFRDFLNLDLKWNPYLRAFHLDYLKYDLLISVYQNVFGSENVLILRNEWLKVDKNRFESELSKFLDSDIELDVSIRSNKSLSNLSIQVLRILNHFTFNSERPNQLIWNRISSKNIWKIFAVILDPYFLKLISARKFFYTKDQKERIADYFHDSNERVNNLIGD